MSKRASRSRLLTSASALRAVKAVHTIIWAFFATCIVALLVVAWRGELEPAIILTGIISVEVLILTVNRLRCPLTVIAARYTDDRRDNFDIYLPVWLARYNKVVFGSLFMAGLGLTLLRWTGWLE